MKKVIVEVEMIQCLRCGYVWKPRIDIYEVRQCPRCKSAHFDKPRKEKKNT